MAIKAILFDKDGTLFDIQASWLPAYRHGAAALAQWLARPALADELLERTGWERASDRLDPAGLLACASNREIAEAWCALAGQPSDALARRVIAELEAEAVRHPIALADVAENLALLRARNLTLGVATMDATWVAEAMLRATKIDHLFAFVAGYDGGHGDKPAPGLVLAFAAQCGLAAGEIAVVGDTPHDMEMARNAGAGLAVGVLTGSGNVSALTPLAHHVIADLGALAALL